MVFSAAAVSLQKSGAAVFSSISAIRRPKAASSKTPPGFVDTGLQSPDRRAQFSNQHLFSSGSDIVIQPKKQTVSRACCKSRLLLHRLLQFFALWAVKLRSLTVAVTKLKFCNRLSIKTRGKT
jgi:hypothetical protein